MLSQSSRHCRACRCQTLHTATVSDFPHILHLLVSVFLCGLWIPVWILLAVMEGYKQYPFRCSRCGMIN